MLAYMHVHVCIYVCMYFGRHKLTYISMSVHKPITEINMYAHTYMYVCIAMYTYMQTHICMHVNM